MKRRPARFVGIDVSKDQLNLAYRPEPTCWRVAHANAGIAQCLAPLRQPKSMLIVLEATGGWQGSLVAALAVRQRPFAVINLRPRRDLARKLLSPQATALNPRLLGHHPVSPR
jgi:transposase